MEINKINLFVKMQTSKPLKIIQYDTGIYEKITPTKAEAKLIERLIKKV